MQVAHFDPVGGAAGDMILGALLAAGLPLVELQRAIDLLQLGSLKLRSERVDRGGIRATRLEVRARIPPGQRHSHDGGRNGPSLGEVDARLAGSRLPDDVVEAASRIFRCLALARASLESRALEDVRFDAVDVLDTFVDVVGSAYALYWFGVARVYCSPLPLRPGAMETPHGLVTFPSALTLQIVQMTSVAARTDGESGEQVTSTGAAILATLADFERPNMRVLKRGAGAGSSDLEIPNIVRVQIGYLQEPLQE